MAHYSIAVFKLLAALAVFAMSAKGQNQQPPCGQRECPPFTAIAQEGVPGEYEVRQYTASWVATTGGPRRTAFMRLFNYIQGQNDQNQKIDMTVPVLRELKATPEGGVEFTTMFYLPAQYQADPPQPLDSQVFVEDWNNRSFYVKVFNTERKATPQEYENALNALRAAIGNPSLYDNNVTYTAGYHSPWFRGTRHNEVWLAKL